MEPVYNLCFLALKMGLWRPKLNCQPVARSVGFMNAAVADPEVRKKKLNAESLVNTKGSQHVNMSWARKNPP